MQYRSETMLILRTSLNILAHVFFISMIATGNWIAILFAIPIILIGGFAVTGFLHRSIAHRTFTINKGWVRKTLLFFSLFSLIGTPLGWAVVHRMHHKNLDEKGDPHSPWQIGFFRSYCHLWQVDESKIDFAGARDIVVNKELQFFHKYNLAMTFVLWLTFYMLFGIIGLYVIGTAAVFAFHAFGVANAVCHYNKMAGPGRFVDLPKMSWLNFGENFHSYHHSFPGSFRFTSTGWDPTADAIEWLVKNNLAELRK